MIVLGSFLKPSYYIHSLTEVISRNFLKILHRNPRDKKMWISPLWRVESISQKFLRFSLPKGFFSWNRHIIIFFVKSTFSANFTEIFWAWFLQSIVFNKMYIVYFHTLREWKSNLRKTRSPLLRKSKYFSFELTFLLQKLISREIAVVFKNLLLSK